MEILPLAFVIPVLLVAACSDLRHLRISNSLSLIALGIFAVFCPLLSFDEMISRLMFAGIVFVIGFLLFAFRIVAGGDVKLLSTLMLFIPSESLVLFGYVFSSSLLISIFAQVCLRATKPRFASEWASVQESGTLAMGVSIAIAGVLHLCFLLVLA